MNRINNPFCMPRTPHRSMSSPPSSPLSPSSPLPPTSHPIPGPTATTPSPSLPPCCSCHSRGGKTGRKQFLSCLDVNNGSHLNSCECEGQCPPSRCGLRHCVTSELGVVGDSPAGRGQGRRLRRGSKRPRSPPHSPHSPTHKRLTTSPLTVVHRVVTLVDEDDESIFLQRISVRCVTDMMC